MDLSASLEAIADRIRSAIDPDASPVIDVGTDPRTLRVPGVLVQFAGFDLDTLAGHTVQARALAITGQTDDLRALDALSAAVAPILAADLEVTGPIVPRGVILPSNPSPLPALFVPVQIHESE